MSEPLWLASLGHGNRSLEQLIELLRWAGLEQLVDVRRFPRSRRHPWFDGDSLQPACEAAGIGYLQLGETLGGYRDGGYQAWMRDPRFEAGLERLCELAATRRTGFMCAELRSEQCHRRHIEAALERRGLEVHQLLRVGRWEPRQRALFDA